jgi:hypothetical protein
MSGVSPLSASAVGRYPRVGVVSESVCPGRSDPSPTGVGSSISVSLSKGSSPGTFAGWSAEAMVEGWWRRRRSEGRR